MANKLLPHSFFDRPVLEVCKDLLGKFLVISDPLNPPARGTSIVSPIRGWIKGGQKAFLITEIEAYDWEKDEACHARFGKTERNAPMFGKPGCWYVYLCYGMYRMLNIVTGPGGHPSAILIRWTDNVKRETKNEDRHWSAVNRLPFTVKLNWPGKLTKHLWITKTFNGKPATKKTWLWIEDRWVMVTYITQKPRVGIDYAGKRAKKKWRFILC